MGAFEYYPYTNFQDLNLDYILERLKALEDDVAVVVELSKTWSDQVDSLNSRMAKIENKNAELYDLYETFVKDIQDEFNDLQAQIVHDFGVLENNIDIKFNNLVDDIDDTLNAFDIRITNLSDRLDYVLNNLPTQIIMINPLTGTQDNLQNIIDDLTTLQRVNALTALQYDNKQLSASAYDAYDLTAYQYDWDGANLL